MGQEEDALGRERECLWLNRLEKDLILVMSRAVKEALEWGTRQELANALQGGIMSTDAMLRKTDDPEWRDNLRRQRQQLVNALCGLGGAAKEEG
jgi:hypothetical protein